MKSLMISSIFGMALAFGQTTPNLMFSLPVSTSIDVLYQIAPGDTTNYNYSFLAANWAKNEVYVTNATNLVVFDSSVKHGPWPVKKTIPLPNPPRNGMLVGPTGMILVMSSAPGAYPSFFPTIDLVDPETGTAKTVWTSDTITDFGINMCSVNGSFSNDGSVFYFVATGTLAGQLYALNTKTWTIAGNWTLDAGESPMIVRVLPNGKIYVLEAGFVNSAPTTEVAVFNPDMTLKTAIKLQTNPWSIGIAPNGLVYLGNQLVTSPTTTKFDPMVVIDSTSDEVVAELDSMAPSYFAWPSPEAPWLAYTGYSGGFRSVNLTSGFTITFTDTQPASQTYGVIAQRQSDGTDEFAVLVNNSLNVYQISEPLITTPNPTINAGGIVDAAGYQPIVSPGGLASIFGSSFTGAPTAATTLPLPTSLEGVMVTVNGTLAPLQYVSPTQINFEVPTNTALGIAKVQVFFENISGSIATVQVDATSPAFFSSNGMAIMTNLAGSLVGLSGTPPLVDGTVYVGWGAGFGKTACSNLPDGAPATDATCTTLVQPILTIGGSSAKILFAGLSPGFVGLYQVNFILQKSSSETTSTNATSPAIVEGTLTAGSTSSTFQVFATQ